MAADRSSTFAGKTAIVCGGSKGIGRETAAELFRRRANVCLIARDHRALDEAAKALRPGAVPGQWVETIACDTSDPLRIAPALEGFIQKRGVPEYLINVTGAAFPDYVGELTIDDYRTQIQENYFSQLVPTTVMLPHFASRGSGHVAFTSSVLGYMGMMGYAAYCPSKYALVGLAEALRHELSPKGLTFSVLFPPDTDTPGFETENQTKPAEWFEIKSEQLMSPQDVASVFVRGLAKKRFYIHPGQSSLLWRVARFSPGLLHALTDREFAGARRRLGNA